MQAAWDGAGNTDEDDANPVTGEFHLRYTTGEENLAGYRFTVYYEDGSKLGNSIDYLRQTDAAYFNSEWYSSAYRSLGSDKKSHIDLNREFSKGTPSITPSDSTYAFTGTDAANGMYLDTSLLTTPTSSLNPKFDIPSATGSS